MSQDIESSRDLAECLALVIDGNATSRGLMAAQLRDYGVGRVVQCTRIQDARTRLENAAFDFVICEQHFSDTALTGQTLLDNLRQAQMLPFATVFFMVTGEASYAKVAEAAESALDGYLLKPFTPIELHRRLTIARTRKAHLRPIFAALEAGDLEKAAQICSERFAQRGSYWIYAARIGAELYIRLAQHDKARALFEAVIAAKALPWAKLGVARVQVDTGQHHRAISTIETLIKDDPGFADAYDVLGQAQVEAGSFEAAMATFRLATEMTPDSVTRLQKLGMLSFYLGDPKEATRALSRAAFLGIGSKLFDFQSIVLLAFSHFENSDRKGLERCLNDFKRILQDDQHAASPRVQLLARIVDLLWLVTQRQFAECVQGVTDLAKRISDPEFNFEGACNLAALLAVLARTSITLSEGESWVRTLGLRFCNTRGLSEMLANACRLHEPYADLVRNCLGEINGVAEKAMARSMGGDPQAAVRTLMEEGSRTLSTKLVDMAHQVLVRYQAKFPDASRVDANIADLRQRCGASVTKANLVQEAGRPVGGINLRLAPTAHAPAFAQIPETEDLSAPQTGPDAFKLRPK